METSLTIKIPEELGRRVEARATEQGLSVDEIILQYLEEFASSQQTTETVTTNPKRRSLTISEFDPKRKLTSEEVAQSLAMLEKMSALAEQIGQRYPNEVIDAVELIREDYQQKL